jgi:hypothetical protein
MMSVLHRQQSTKSGSGRKGGRVNGNGGGDGNGDGKNNQLKAAVKKQRWR